MVLVSKDGVTISLDWVWEVLDTVIIFWSIWLIPYANDEIFPLISEYRFEPIETPPTVVDEAFLRLNSAHPLVSLIDKYPSYA